LINIKAKNSDMAFAMARLFNAEIGRLDQILCVIKYYILYPLPLLVYLSLS